MHKETLNIASQIRKDLLSMTHTAQSSHSGSGLSMVDILCAIYSKNDRVNKIKTGAPDRDYVIISKGHAAAALYATLANFGLFSRDVLETFCSDGSLLGGHVTSGITGIELSTGSLGHGLPYGIGIAIGNKKNNLGSKVIVVISDGECDEGTTWESALIANHFKLDNLVLIIDRNGIQSLAPTEETIALEPLDLKWESFGWKVTKTDGHNIEEMANAISYEINRPHVIIANTIKGKGVSFMENSVLWHYKSPNLNELNLATIELDLKS